MPKTRPFYMLSTIVMTGGTSGLGEVAARRFIQTPNTRLLLGARRGGLLGAETFPLDLMRLESVRSFASTVDRELGPAQIDSLVLNAGLLFPNAGLRSADGFEAAFAVNHLAHYLLLRLLLPRLAQGATVILTTSGTHDPAERTIIAPPLHADARYLAHPERDPNRDPHPLIAGGRTDSSSKLCNLLTARALAAQPDTTARRLTIIAYDPGHTPVPALFATKISQSICSGNHSHRLCASCCAARTLPKPRATHLPNSPSARSPRRPVESTPRFAAESSTGPTLPNWRVETISAMHFGGIVAYLLVCQRGEVSPDAERECTCLPFPLANKTFLGSCEHTEPRNAHLCVLCKRLFSVLNIQRSRRVLARPARELKDPAIFGGLRALRRRVSLAVQI